MMNSLHPKRLLRETWLRIRNLREQPRAVAGGVAIGIFWSFTPFTGLKTALSLFTAWLCGRSKLAAVAAVALHDLLFPIWPIVLRWEYQIGYWLIHRPHCFPPKLSRSHLSMAELFQWKTIGVLWPMFVGSCLIGGPIAIALYFIVLRLLRPPQSAGAEAA